MSIRVCVPGLPCHLATVTTPYTTVYAPANTNPVDGLLSFYLFRLTLTCGLVVSSPVWPPLDERPRYADKGSLAYATKPMEII